MKEAKRVLWMVEIWRVDTKEWVPTVHFCWTRGSARSTQQKVREHFQVTRIVKYVPEAK